jgi:TonB family protein
MRWLLFGYPASCTDGQVPGKHRPGRIALASSGPWGTFCRTVVDRAANSGKCVTVRTHARFWSTQLKIGSYRRQMMRLSVAVLAISLVSIGVWGQESRRAIYSPQPEYPEMAKKMKLTGVVKIEVTIGADGKVKDTRVIGGHPLLVDAAVKALKGWKYAPASADSKAQIEFKF